MLFLVPVLIRRHRTSHPRPGRRISKVASQSPFKRRFVIGKGAGYRYLEHLHVDLLVSKAAINKGTYYNSMSELRKWYIDPLTRIPQ